MAKVRAVAKGAHPSARPANKQPSHRRWGYLRLLALSLPRQVPRGKRRSVGRPNLGGVRARRWLDVLPRSRGRCQTGELSSWRCPWIAIGVWLATNIGAWS